MKMEILSAMMDRPIDKGSSGIVVEVCAEVVVVQYGVNSPIL